MLRVDNFFREEQPVYINKKTWKECPMCLKYHHNIGELCKACQLIRLEQGPMMV